MDLQKILDKYGVRCDVRIILEKWNEPDRHYHTLNHLVDLISQINEDFGDGKITSHEREKLLISALFHDAVYEIGSNLNEENSAELFHRLCSDKHDIDVVEIKQIILDTKNHFPSTPLSSKFQNYDMKICERTFDQLLEWEMGIRKECSQVTETEYKKNRLQFLEGLISKYPANMDNILDLINWVKLNY